MSIIPFSLFVAFTFFFSTTEEHKNSFNEVNQPTILKRYDSIPQGKMNYELYFSEWNGRMKNLQVEIVIKGNKITVYNTIQTPLSGGKIIIEGVLMKHKTGKWIIGKNDQDAYTDEIGGCSDGPIIIDFETKIIEWC